MISWRDNASQQAQNDLDQLFNESLNAAIHFLDKNKEFYPFAYTLLLDGDFSLVAIGSEKDFPDSQSIISDLLSALRSASENYRAVAIIADVSINQGKDSAIKISLEHCEKVAIEIVVSYNMRGVFKKKTQVGTISAFSIESFVWTSK